MTPESAMAASSTAPARHVELIRRACAYIDGRDGEPVTLAELAGHLEVSPWHLQRLFKKATGVTPRDYADARRAARFRDGLKRGATIAGATYEAGYGSSSRVYEGARWQLGMTPASYAKGGKGARMAYDIVDSPLGRLLVAATRQGICFVCLGDEDGPLIRALETDRPGAGAAGRLSGRPDAAPGPAAGYPGDRLSAPGLAGADRDSLRRDPDLFRDR